MMPPSIDAPFARARRPWLWIILLIITLDYTWFLANYGASWAGGADSSGYLNSARLIREGKLREPARFAPGFETSAQWVPALSQPLGYTTTYSGNEVWLAPAYPVGLPLHLAAASWIVGLDDAPILVNILIALVTGFALSAFGHKLGFATGWTLGGVFALACCPLYLYYLLQPMSDALALMWCLVALWLAWLARDCPFWALASGLALAIAVLVRPTDILILPAVAIALGSRWRAWTLLIAGGLPGAIFLLLYNQHLYGSPFASGYSSVNQDFGLSYALKSIPHVTQWMLVVLSPLVLGLAAYGVWSLRHARTLFCLLIAWIAVPTLFYLFYSYTHQTWWYLRFILPVFPAVLIAAMAGAQALFPKRATASAYGWAAALACGLFSWQIYWAVRLHVHSIKPEERTYPVITSWAQENLPSNAILLQMQVSGAFHYYTRFTMFRWDHLTPQDFRVLRQKAAATGRPIYAVLYDFEQNDFDTRIGGQWEKITTYRNAVIWKYQESGAITLAP